MKELKKNNYVASVEIRSKFFSSFDKFDADKLFNISDALKKGDIEGANKIFDTLILRQTALEDRK